MPRTKPSAAKTPSVKSSNGKRANVGDVLTLTEAAAYLRVAESDVVQVAQQHGLPGQQIGHQWRFLKSALDDWLRQPSGKHRLLRHAGAAKDDPHLDEILARIYRDRGRPVSKNSDQ